jgi:hypothetical protein
MQPQKTSATIATTKIPSATWSGMVPSVAHTIAAQGNPFP